MPMSDHKCIYLLVMGFGIHVLAFLRHNDKLSQKHVYDILPLIDVFDPSRCSFEL